MSGVLGLIRWEWFKLQRRLMPWILLVLLLLFSQLAVWGGFFRYNRLEATGGQIPLQMERGRFETVACNDILAGDTSALPAGSGAEIVAGLQAQCRQQAPAQAARLWELYELFSLPGTIGGALGTAQTVGLILLAILAASLVGAEYGLGTLRPVIARGTGRGRYLAAKFAVLTLVTSGALLITAAVAALSGTIAVALTQPPPGEPLDAKTWMDSAIALGKTFYSMMPFVALAAVFTLLTRSTAVGMAIGLGYYFAEQIAVALLSNLFEWFPDVAEYLLVQNITAMVSEFSDFTFGQVGGGPSQAHAFAVLGAYLVALMVGAFWLFARRDIAGASAG